MSLLKLWYCSAIATDHDWVEIIVAETHEKASEIFLKMVEESGSWYAGTNVSELSFEDYEITIKKK